MIFYVFPGPWFKNMSGSAYIGWALPEAERERLLHLFPAAYPDVIAHHITLVHGVPLDAPIPTVTAGKIVGVADDGERVQALVVAIVGQTQRPDGKTYHITWSIDRAKGAKPVHSNAVISEHGFSPCPPIPIRLIPSRFAITPTFQSAP